MSPYTGIIIFDAYCMRKIFVGIVFVLCIGCMTYTWSLTSKNEVPSYDEDGFVITQ
jgi:hypothetical protein